MSKGTVIASIAFSTLAVILVLGIVVFGVDEATTPYIASVLGFLSLAVTQMVNNAKVEKTETTVNELNKDLRNGTFERLVREALTKIAADETTALHITQERKEDGNGRG